MNQQSRMILAIVLSMGIVFGYQAFFAPPPPTSQESSQTQGTSAQQEEAQPKEAAPSAADPAKGSAAVQSQAALVHHDLHGDKLGLDLSNSESGLVEQVHLTQPRFAEKDEQGHAIGLDFLNLSGASSLDLRLKREGSNFQIPRGNAQVVTSTERVFEVKRSSDEMVLTQRIEVLDGYEAKYTITLENLSAGELRYAWIHDLRMGVRPKKKDRNAVFTALCGNVSDTERETWSDVEDLKDPMSLEVEHPRWVGLSTKYFLGALVSAKRLDRCLVEPGSDGEAMVVRAISLSKTLAAGQRAQEDWSLYFGPKDTRELTALSVVGDQSLEAAVDWGWFGGLSKAIGSVLLHVLRWFYDLTGVWGVAIILLTVVVKLVTLPLTLKQYASMKAMREIAPELKELQAKFGDDPVKLNQERQSLLTRKGVNPLAGCLPMLVQFPIWIALYAMLGTAVELYHEPFLWLKDLTKPDTLFILPIGLAAMSWLQMHIQPNSGDPQQQAVMKWMMPAVFLVMMWFLPSGLGVYMFANITLTLIQSYIQLGPARKEAKAAASK